MIRQLNDLNLKVSTAIELYKHSERVLANDTDYNRKISTAEKALLMRDNDVVLHHIAMILTSHFDRRSSSRHAFGPMIHYRDLTRQAEEALRLNIKLAEWGMDAGFLAAGRGYAIYHFVFNCIRSQDPHLIALQMSARAFAVRTAAESESYFSGRSLRLDRFRPPRPKLQQWEVEKQIIDGGRGYGGGFPEKIFLGSEHGFTRPRFGGQDLTTARCKEGEVRSYYGNLKRVGASAPGVIRLFELDGGPDIINGVESDCQSEINAWGREAISLLLTNGFRGLFPQGGKDQRGYEIMLGGIVEAINGHITRITRDRDYEACVERGDANCALIIAGGTTEDQRSRAREAREERDEVAERARRGEEYKALREYAEAIRNALSSEPIIEDRRSYLIEELRRP